MHEKKWVYFYRLITLFIDCIGKYFTDELGKNAADFENVDIKAGEIKEVDNKKNSIISSLLQVNL